MKSLFHYFFWSGWQTDVLQDSPLSRDLLDIETKIEMHNSFGICYWVILIILLCKQFIWELSVTDNFYSLSD